MPTIQLTRSEITFLLISVLVMVVGLAIWSWAGSSEINPEADPWPQVVRTIDGTTTAVMPEDLDRPTG